MNPARRELLLRWLLALGVGALLLFFFSPAWAAFRLWARVPEMGGLVEVRRGVSVLQQAVHPGAVITDPLHRAIQWRLLFPSIAHVLGLPGTVLFGFAPLGCLVLLGYIITVLRRTGAAWFATAQIAVVVGAASWFFTSTGWLGYYDSWFALALVVLAFGRSPWVVWAACVWAPWVDERIVVAAPLALLCRWIYATELGRAPKDHEAPAGKLRPALDVRSEIAIPAALLSAFAVVRVFVLGRYSDPTATVAGYLHARNYLDAPFGRILHGIGQGLRLGWIAVIFALFASPRRPLAILLAAVACLTLIVGLATAQDYSRSMTMLLPLAVLGGCLSVASKHLTWFLRGAPLFAAAALLLPAAHVMNDRVTPIYYLYHSLAALHTPPAVAMPEVYELRAIHAMERGDFGAAESDLTLAIKLADNPASPARQRGVLYASANRWGDARRDFALATEHDAENPDAWFLQAQASLAVGDPAAARSEFDRARSLASPEWMTRPDVARFAAKLATARP
jgi:hypothetical protein